MYGKNILREKILKERKNFQEIAYITKNEIIFQETNNILNVYADYKNPVVGLYWAIKGEPDLIKLSVYKNRSLALPKIRDKKMNFVNYNLGDHLERSLDTKLIQPRVNSVVIPQVIVIPGLAFDINGYRLGFGSGYYDRFFASLSVKSKIIKIGVCFHEYLYEYVPRENHDIRLDYIITDKTVISL